MPCGTHGVSTWMGTCACVFAMGGGLACCFKERWAVQCAEGRAQAARRATVLSHSPVSAVVCCGPAVHYCLCGCGVRRRWCATARSRAGGRGGPLALRQRLPNKVCCSTMLLSRSSTQRAVHKAADIYTPAFRSAQIAGTRDDSYSLGYCTRASSLQATQQHAATHTHIHTHAPAHAHTRTHHEEHTKTPDMSTIAPGGPGRARRRQRHTAQRSAQPISRRQRSGKRRSRSCVPANSCLSVAWQPHLPKALIIG